MLAGSVTANSYGVLPNILMTRGQPMNIPDFETFCKSFAEIPALMTVYFLRSWFISHQSSMQRVGSMMAVRRRESFDTGENSILKTFAEKMSELIQLKQEYLPDEFTS